MVNNLGKIHIYTGNGKGKTSAALGLALRAAGNGKKVAIIFFDKGGDYYCERKILNKLGKNLVWFAYGRQRFYPRMGKFITGTNKIDQQEAEKGLKKISELFLQKNLNVLVLDEIINALNLKMIKLENFLLLLDNKPKRLEIVLTGRKIPPQLKQRADLITEMKNVKHYLSAGTFARKGIDY